MNFKKVLLISAAVLAGQQTFAQSTTALNALTGTLPGTPAQYLGSSNAADVLFKSTNVERMRILSTGNIGIGTTAPVTALTVQTAATNNGIRIIQTGTTASSLGLFNTSAGARNWGLLSTGAGNGQGAGNFSIYDHTALADRFFIQGSTGNVGVGTTTPSFAKFQVTGNVLVCSSTGAPTSAALIRGNSGLSTQTTPEYTWYNNDQTGIFHPALNTIGFTINGAEKVRINTLGFVGMGTTAPLFRAHVNGDLFVTGTGGGAYGTIGSPGGATMYLGDIDTQPQWGIEYDDPNTTTGSIAGGVNFWRPSGSFGIGGNYVLFLKNDSKVGIHTNNPTADFTVNGNMLVGDPSSVNLPAGYKLYVQTGILTEKVKVALTTTTDWADYVFESNYSLKSLEDVKAFVDANKHLPGVPSAQELKDQGGIDLGKMDAKLMEKIEELTLYIIQINKEKNELADRLTKLESSK